MENKETYMYKDRSEIGEFHPFGAQRKHKEHI